MVFFFDPFRLVLMLIVASLVLAAVLALVVAYWALIGQTLRVMRDSTLDGGSDWPRDGVTIGVSASALLLTALATYPWMMIRDEAILVAGFPIVGLAIAACLLARRLKRPSAIGMIVCSVAMFGPLWFPLLTGLLFQGARSLGHPVGWALAPLVLAVVVVAVLCPLLWIATRSTAVVLTTAGAAIASASLSIAGVEWSAFRTPMALATAPLLIGPSAAVSVQTLWTAVPGAR